MKDSKQNLITESSFLFGGQMYLMAANFILKFSYIGTIPYCHYHIPGHIYRYKHTVAPFRCIIGLLKHIGENLRPAADIRPLFIDHASFSIRFKLWTDRLFRQNETPAVMPVVEGHPMLVERFIVNFQGRL